MVPRLLLFTPLFYGLENKIRSEIEKSGFEVIWIENKTLTLDYHGTNSKLKFFRKIYFFLFFPETRYIKREFRKIENLRFDVLFSINGHVTCPYLFRKLKSINPGLFSVLYLWDTFSMFNWTKEIQYFDKAYSFDHANAIKYGIEYKPNFYVKSKTGENHDIEYDLFFVGKFNPYRLSLIDTILKQVQNSSISCFISLWPGYKIFCHNQLLYKIFRKLNIYNSWVKDYLLNYEAVEGILKREYLIKSKLTYDEIQYLSLSSNVIMDIPFPYQTGYSHRLIEALANGKKVITTNTNIKAETFYNSNQISVIDTLNPEIDILWIRGKENFSVDPSFSDLELSIWLKSVLDVPVA